MCCRGRADCRPGRTDHSERGKRLGGAGSLVAARQGPMPADAAGAWRSPRSSRSRGKPGTWRRRTAGRQRETPFGRSGVNTSAPLDAKQAEERVLGWQTKLHRWAGEEREKRFGDLFNLVCDPAMLLVAWERVKRIRGSRIAGVVGISCERIDTPLPVREHAIPKRRSGKVHTLGIPALADRIVQMALVLVLEPICEAD